MVDGMQVSALNAVLLTAVLLCGLMPDQAGAASNVTYVSGKGADTGACTFAAPCRTMQFAFGKTSTNGEIHAIDPADFGPIAINRSVRLIGTKGASLSRTNAGAIVGVTVGTAYVEVSGFIIEGGYTGLATYGVQSTSGSLVIKDCVIENVRVNGIAIAPAAAGKTALIEDTTIQRSQQTGVYLIGGTGIQLVTMNRVTVENAGGYGIWIMPGIAARVTDSTIAHSGYDGISVFRSATAILNLAHSNLIGNSRYGLLVDTTGYAQSDGDNAFLGNGVGATFGNVITTLRR